MSQWIANGVTDQYIYFEAPPGLGPDTWTVRSSLNKTGSDLWTTPAVSEISQANLPGLYALLVDEQTTMTAGNITESLALHISSDTWTGKIVIITIYDPNEFDVNVKSINGTDVQGTGTGGDLWRG